MSWIKRSGLLAGIVLVAYALFWFTFFKQKQAVMGLGILIIAAALAGRVGSYGRAFKRKFDTNETSAGTGRVWSFFCGLLGLGAAWIAMQAGIDQHWGRMAVALMAGAVAWKGVLPSALPKVSSRQAVAMLLGLLLVAGFYRLYQAGNIPYGMAMSDEPRIKIASEKILLDESVRPSFMVWGGVLADGVIPFYSQALGMKVFGRSLKGSRMSGILAGTLVAALIFLIAWYRGEAWLGLAAGLFWAICVWPVTVSRAEYLVSVTHLIVLLTVALLMAAIRRRSMVLFGLAGLSWAACFNVYSAAQIMLALLPWLLMLFWLMKEDERETLRAGLAPLLAGLLIGLAPLLIFGYLDPDSAFRAYFGGLYAGHTSGPVPGNLGFFGRMDAVLERAIPEFTHCWGFFTKHGPFSVWYLPRAYPAYSPWILFLFFAGFSVCLARFREPLLAFLLFWWSAGLLPGLVAVAVFNPNDRRLMMSLPPFLLIAGVGAMTALDACTRIFKGRLKVWILALLMGLGGLWAAKLEWHNYFQRNQLDQALLEEGRANGTALAKAVYEESLKAPSVLIMGKKPVLMNWYQPANDPFAMVFRSLNPDPPLQYMQTYPDYFSNHGLYELLRWGAGQKIQSQPTDVLVSLGPFHYYLEPLLHRLGGVTVRSIPAVLGTNGQASRDDLFVDPSSDSIAKVIRLHGLSAKAVDDLEVGTLFDYRLERLWTPSINWPIRNEPAFGERNRKYVDEVVARSPRWPVKAVQRFSVPDPWFWTTVGNLPGGKEPPYRLQLRFWLKAPVAGAYRFGASSTLRCIVRIDGRKAFDYSPGDGTPLSEIKEGLLGLPLTLTAGEHRVDVEQVCVGIGGDFNDLLRMVWSGPGIEKQTLPLSVMQPSK